MWYCSVNGPQPVCLRTKTSFPWVSASQESKCGQVGQAQDIEVAIDPWTRALFYFSEAMTVFGRCAFHVSICMSWMHINHNKYTDLYSCAWSQQTTIMCLPLSPSACFWCRVSHWVVSARLAGQWFSVSASRLPWYWGYRYTQPCLAFYLGTGSSCLVSCAWAISPAPLEDVPLSWLAHSTAGESLQFFTCKPHCGVA